MGGLDPIADSPLEHPAEPTPEDISARLENKETGEARAEDEGKPTPETPAVFDPSMFTAEQLQQLKLMLNSTPDRPTNKNKGMTIRLREINGKIVKDFGTAYNGYVTDPQEPTRKQLVPKIKVSFFGQDEPEEMLYTEFMDSPRKRFDVLGTRTETEEIAEGETVSNETGRLVTMLTVYQHRFFTIEVDGNKVEISDKVANS